MKRLVLEFLELLQLIFIYQLIVTAVAIYEIRLICVKPISR
jgi:hypothetical protein